MKILSVFCNFTKHAQKYPHDLESNNYNSYYNWAISENVLKHQ